MPEPFAVTDRISDRWLWWGGAGGPFGPPLAAAETVPGRNGVRQRFERGEIAWSFDQDMVTSVYLLRNEACLEWSRPGFDFDYFRYEVECDGVSQDHAKVQIAFNHLHPEDELLIWTRLQGFGEFSFAVKSCTGGDDCHDWTIPVRLRFGPRGRSPFSNDLPVEGLIADRWHELGAWDGPLGRPITVARFDPDANGLRQEFERGVIQTVPSQGAHMVVAGYQRNLPNPSIELNWGPCDTSYNHFRIDAIFNGQKIDSTKIHPVLFDEWARSGRGSGQYRLLQPGREGAYFFHVHASTAPPESGVINPDVLDELQDSHDLIVRIGVRLELGTPWIIPVEPALDGSPAAAYASQRDRALAVARSFAATRPLQVTFQFRVREDAPGSGENEGVQLMAHLAAAAEEPDFCPPGELPSLVLAHIALRQLRLGKLGTHFDEDYGPVHVFRDGEYDTALKGILVIAYRYRHLLTDSEFGFILHRLVPPGLSDGHDVQTELVSVEVDFDPLAELGVVKALGLLTSPAFEPAIAVGLRATLAGVEEYFLSDLPESENHLLMIESARYLVNQLFLEKTGEQRYDNRRNGMLEWLLGRLQTIAKHDFMEFNARIYTRYSIHALLNLHEFADDVELRTMAHNILDYAAVRFAVSSNRLRRVNPYRRLMDHRNRPPFTDGDGKLHEEFDDLFSQDTDPMTGFFLTWTGERDRRGRPLSTFPARWSFWSVLVGQAAYRPPPQAYTLAMTEYPPAQHTLYHGTRPKVAGSNDIPDGGVEIYYRSPSFLLSAGGMFLNSGYGRDDIVVHYKDAAIAQSTTLIPTLAEVRFHDLIRFDAYPDDRRAVNTGVHKGFACGANLQITDAWYEVAQAPKNERWTFLNLNTELGPLHPDEEKLGPLGFYLAAYRTPPSPLGIPDDIGAPPVDLGMLYAMEAGPPDNPVMSFDDFEKATRDRNQLPDRLVYGDTYDFHTADGHTFTCRLSTEGNKYAARVLSMDGEDLPADLTRGPLVHGPYMNAPGVHDGHIIVTAPDCDVPLDLDSRDAQHPSRTDTETACAQAHLERAKALVAVASRNRAASATASTTAVFTGMGSSIRAARGAVGVLRGFRPPDEVAAQYRHMFAGALHDLVFRLMTAGRLDEIPRVATETVVAYVQASGAPGADPTPLGSELLTLSSRMADLALNDAAILAARAATQVFTAGTPPVGAEATYLKIAANAQHNLVIRLIVADKLADAAEAADQAIAAYRRAAATPGTDRRQIGDELHALSVRLSGAGLTNPATTAEAAANEILAS